MRIKKVIGILVFGLVSIWLVHGAYAFSDCILSLNPSLQPASPLEMNSVKKVGWIKTVKAEKMVFECDSGRTIVDVEIFLEILENMFETQIPPSIPSSVSKKFEVITCIKDLASATVTGCSKMIPPRVLIRVGGCSVPTTPPIYDPVEMNTVESGNYVKTIKAEKERFYCSLYYCGPGSLTTCAGPVIADVNTIIEIIEKTTLVHKHGWEIGPYSKKYEVATCVILESTATVLGCYATGATSMDNN
jgi:hypothetical protein